MPFTVQHFMDEYQKQHPLEVVAGAKYLHRQIPERVINRPGLALAGYMDYFANKRMQVLGLAELTFLKSLAPAVLEERLRLFFQKSIPCLVLTRGRQISSVMKALAEEYRIPVLKSPEITGDFITRATLTLENLHAPELWYQGTFLDVMGVGVLIDGPPAIGKSEVVMGFLQRGYSLISDDMTLLRRDSTGHVFGTASEATRYHMEIRGLGILHVPSLFGISAVALDKRLDMFISLYKQPESDIEDRSGLTPKSRNVLDLDFPLTTLPVAPGRDMSHVIEVAVRNQKLKFLGHDAAKEFDARLMNRLAQGM